MPKNRSEEKELDQRIVREWLAELPQRTGLAFNAIAKVAKVATSTLTNPVNRPDKVPHTTSFSTLLKISRATGVPLPPGFSPEDNIVPLAGRGFQSEAVEFRYDAAPDINRIIEAYCAPRPGVDAWVLRTAAVSRRGYLPGSIVVLDTNAEWREDAVVCANWYPKRSAQPITVWRVFRGAWLYGDSAGPEMIEPIDEGDCDRKGVLLFGLNVPGYRR